MAMRRAAKGQIEYKKAKESSFPRKKRGRRAIKTRKNSIIILNRMNTDLNLKRGISSKDLEYNNRGKQLPRQRRAFSNGKKQQGVGV
jgi:hypothetical protein